LDEAVPHLLYRSVTTAKHNSAVGRGREAAQEVDLSLDLRRERRIEGAKAVLVDLIEARR
jgi:hypothetical protein